MKKPVSDRFFGCLFLSSAVLLGSTVTGSAATLTITTTNDSGAGSLRQAIADAASGDTINFSIVGTIYLTSDELLITNNLTLIGPGANNLVISGNYARRVLEIRSSATVTILGVSISNGRSVG